MPIPLTTRTRRTGLALLAAGLLATGAAACEPPPPPPAFTVDPSATGADADPGDGACATAQAACSLQAAVEEANALDTATDITLLEGVVNPIDLTVTGSIDLIGSATVLDLTDVSFTVAEGAKLIATDVYMDAAEVHGTFATRRVALGETSTGGAVDPVVDVGPTGRVMLTNTWLSAWDRPAADNAGTLVLHSTTVQREMSDETDPATITTEPGADTRLAATIFLGDFPWTCAGTAPTSLGYNLAANDSCGLDQPGDRQDVREGVGLTDESARVDAIPEGVLQCGDGWRDDIDTLEARPADGDDDGSVACDIGAEELGEQAPPVLTVAIGGTAGDTEPGDGVCATEAGGCSFRAAVDEANALGAARIAIATFETPAQAATITGDVALYPAAPKHAELNRVDLTVGPDAEVDIREVRIRSLTVQGEVFVNRSDIGDAVTHTAIQERPYLVVAAGGTARLANSYFDGQYAPSIGNAGTIWMQGVTFAKYNNLGPDIAAITTQTGGATHISASQLLGDPDLSVDACAGLPPISHGYNLSYDATCGFDAVGDGEDVVEDTVIPYRDSLRLDAIPIGTLGCGNTWTDHFGSHGFGPEADVRPIDVDEDGTAACDIGHWEQHPDDAFQD